MYRRRKADHPAPTNEATREAMYRAETARSAPINTPAMRYCRGCGKMRTARQFDGGQKLCELCRGPIGAQR